MKLNYSPFRNGTIISKKLNNGIMLVSFNQNSRKSPTAYLLEESSVDIWKLIDGKHDIKKIINCLSYKYDASNDKIRNFVFDFLKKLEREKIILFKKEDDSR